MERAADRQSRARAWSRWWLLSAIPSLALVVFIAVSLRACEPRDGAWNEAGISASKDRATIVIQCVALYLKKHKRLPTELSDVEREYNMTLPTPCAGYPRWRYRVLDGGGGYELGFGDSSEYYPQTWYDSRDDQWRVDK
jgi:hypothetical protein